MPTSIIVGIVLVISVITAGITADTYMTFQHQINCIKAGGTMEQLVGRYSSSVCTINPKK